MHKYKQIKPDWSYERQRNAVRMLINGADVHNLIEKQTGFYLVNGSHRQLGFLDNKLDDVLLELVRKDIL